MRLLFESLPIMLSMIALMTAFRRAVLTRNQSVRIAAWMGFTCAVLLITAQTSWAWSVSVGNMIGEDYANRIWTIFNTSVVAYIMYVSLKATK